MYFVLYDRNLKTIGETYKVESWKQTLRAIDFDETSIVGEQIEYSSNPFFVVVNDKQGKQLFSGLASTPSIDEKTKKTTISLKDYLTLLNSDVIINWDIFKGKKVSDFISFVFDAWKEQINVGFNNVFCSFSDDVLNEDLEKELHSLVGKENVLAYNLISNAIYYYNLYVETKLNLKEKTLTFNFKKACVQSLSINLKDFGVMQIEKSFGDFNKVTIYSKDFIQNQEWALTQKNNVVKLPTTEELVYPVKNRNFIAEEKKETYQDDNGQTVEVVSDGVNEAVYKAVMELSKNRYQENIDLNAQQYKTVIDLTNINFSYSIKVYTNEGKYKDLPVGEIEKDSKGKNIVRLGHRVQELTQEL